MNLIDLKERETAACDLRRNYVVTAGAGTGKTSLLVERALHHLLERGTPLEALAAVTFTRKAAAELRERLEDGLERALETIDARGQPSPESEAGRVLARLPAILWPHAGRRARAALEALDDAPLGTIHSFAADVLRRHHLAAGVDLDFTVDEDGLGAAGVFDELWGSFLEERLGKPSDDPSWRRLLMKLAPEELEGLARGLCEYRIPFAAIGEEGVEAQRAELRSLQREADEDIRHLRAATAPEKGGNRNLPAFLDELAALFDEATKGNVPAADSAIVTRSTPTLGSRLVAPDTGALVDTLRRLHGDARKLAGADIDLVRDLGVGLEPFLHRFRDEHLRRGFVSHDALIVLARDLLRDRPDIRREEGDRLSHLLVDEFQDTDPLQYEIVFFLAEAARDTPGGTPRDAYAVRLEPGKLFIVGDAKQSIYRFRGADIDAYRRAVKTVSAQGGKVLTLRTNFRSVPELVEPINRLFEKHFQPLPAGGAGAADPDYTPLAPRRGAAGRPSIEVWSVGKGDEKAPERRQIEAAVTAAWLRERIDAGELRAADAAILLRALSEVEVILRSLRAWGIPYIVEGGRGFYQRYEVELLLTLLRLVANPADTVSLVSCLRSPLGAVPDRELQEFATALGERGESWRLGIRPPAKKYPALARAVERLQSFVERHRDESFDRVARAALDEAGLRLAMAASYEGAQRVANLEKAVRRIGELTGDGRLGPEDVIERLESEEASVHREGDSPLADETVDAVKVLSIHKAKGLEWPVVILPDLARDVRAGLKEEPIVEVTRGWSGSGRRSGALALKSGNVRTPAWIPYNRHERTHELAEAKRLFYVGATRARDWLVLLAGAPGRSRSTWIHALDAWGYRLRERRFPDEGTLLDGQVVHRCARTPPLVERGAARPVAPPAVLDAALRFEAISRAISSRAGDPPLRSPSSETESSAPGGRSPSTAARVDRAIARAAGSALHLLLEVWDRDSPGWLDDNAKRAVEVVLRDEESDDIDPGTADEVLRLVQRMLARAAASGRLEAIASLPVLGREVPMLYRDDDGVVWRGSIDLLAGGLDAPGVIDFKTDPGASEEELAARHAGQLKHYAEAVRRALNLGTDPEVRVEALAAD